MQKKKGGSSLRGLRVSYGNLASTINEKILNHPPERRKTQGKKKRKIGGKKRKGSTATDLTKRANFGKEGVTTILKCRKEGNRDVYLSGGARSSQGDRKYYGRAEKGRASAQGGKVYFTGVRLEPHVSPAASRGRKGCQGKG